MVKFGLLLAMLAFGPAAAQADFVFDNQIRRSDDLPTQTLRNLRKGMVAGRTLSARDLQALADAGDGLAAFRFARLLESVPDAKPAVIVHYYAIAAYTGRAFAVPPLARWLVAEDAAYPAATLRQALDALTVQAKAGNTDAAAALGRMYAKGQPFGRDLAKAQGYLALMPVDQSPKAALRLGISLMADPADKALGHPAARAALTIAAAGPDLGTSLTATTLLGQLAPPDAKAAP